MIHIRLINMQTTHKPKYRNVMYLRNSHAKLLMNEGYAMALVRVIASYNLIPHVNNVGIVFALSTLFMVPALIIFIHGQDDLGEGIGYSGRK